MTATRFFRFREQLYGHGSQPIVGFAAKEVVSSVVSLREMGAFFGGYLEYEKEGGEWRYLGVWGDRKVGRFLRLLRERGAVLEVGRIIC